jgi:DNA-binding response OmpR family regulator
MSRILVIEDDEHVRDFLVRGLSAVGYAMRSAGGLDEALALIAEGGHDLVLLDLGLPDGDGFALLERIRSAGSRTPVIVLTGSRFGDRAASCLDGGADDFVRKPFELRELTARIRARLRSSDRLDPRVIGAGDLRIDLASRRASRAARRAELTGRELALLETLLRHRDELVSREYLLSAVWGYDFDPGTNILSVYVAALRRKLGADLIETVHGRGYRLRTPAALA